jgi:all-trans-retinol 13,14-reductase
MQTSTSAFTAHFILKEKSFPYLNYNRYHFHTNEVWVNHSHRKADRWPENMLIFTPASSKAMPYADHIGVMCAMPFEEVMQWSDSFHTADAGQERSPEYLQWKASKEEAIQHSLEQLYPELQGNIIAVHSSTPLTYRDYLSLRNGAIYGVVKDYKHPLDSYIAHRTKISNLFLSGQDVNLHGIYGVAMSALLTCGEFMPLEDLLKAINEH